MPLEAIAINSLNTPLIKKPARENELSERLHALYDSDDAQPTGEEVLSLVEQGFKRGQYLYVGMFNDKPIAAVACFDDGQTDAKRLQYLTVHPQNRDRAIDAKFIKLVYDAEVKKGVREFVPADADIHRIMSECELLRVKG
ncbi:MULTISPECIES: hypothetical protein [Psychrobacter]|uniref:Uncharacterized protein n=1 Tax=Psychrobacter alimentarius TaxID=261164 RepID=A0ABM6A1H6_9GAMM|nr:MULTISPECIES: hypothetical protein [Psychrobacter]AMT98268.1 hypothetical protein A3K91_2701 [Psychrobacter alimentarius]QCB31947.1 hypothetical protein E5677_13645 [Psychrobacter sp. PAMC27889]